MFSATNQSISIKLATTIIQFLTDLDFANVYMASPSVGFFLPFFCFLQDDQAAAWKLTAAHARFIRAAIVVMCPPFPETRMGERVTKATPPIPVQGST